MNSGIKLFRVPLFLLHLRVQPKALAQVPADDGGLAEGEACGVVYQDGGSFVQHLEVVLLLIGLVPLDMLCGIDVLHICGARLL